MIGASLPLEAPLSYHLLLDTGYLHLLPHGPKECMDRKAARGLPLLLVGSYAMIKTAVRPMQRYLETTQTGG